MIWAERGRYGELNNRLKVFLDGLGEGTVEIRYEKDADQARVTDANWYGSLESTLPPKFLSPQPTGERSSKPFFFRN